MCFRFFVVLFIFVDVLVYDFITIKFHFTEGDFVVFGLPISVNCNSGLNLLFFVEWKFVSLYRKSQLVQHFAKIVLTSQG